MIERGVIIGDFEQVMQNVDHAVVNNREIDDATARVIASMYHEGQWSVSYSFTSTGAIADLFELYRECFPNYDDLSTDEKLVADMFCSYVTRHGKRGPVDGWSKLWV